MLLALTTDSPGLFIAIGAAAGWLVREVVVASLQRVWARAGRIGYVQKQCGYYSLSRTEDGQELESRWHPEYWPDRFPELLALPLKIEGDLYNESDTPVVFTKATVRFWGPEGLRFEHQNPTVLANGSKAVTITVPGHGTTRLTIIVNLLRDMIVEKCPQTVPEIRLKLPDGTERGFYASGSSFYGDPLAFLPRKGQRPVVYRSSD